MKRRWKIKKPVVCHYCKLSFGSRETLKEHLTIHRPFVCELCQRRFPERRKLNAHIKDSHAPKDLKCLKCGHEFSAQHRLNFHLKTVHPENLFACENLLPNGRACGKLFKLKASLKLHQQRAHGSGELFECPKESCKAVFFSQFDLDKHVKYYHTQRISCEHCEATFPFKSFKEKHEKMYHPPGQEPLNPKDRRTCLLCGVRLIFGPRM